MAITILLRTYYNLRLLFLYVNRNTYIRKSIEMDFVKKYRLWLIVMPEFFADVLMFLLGFILIMGGVQQIASLSMARRWTPVPGIFYLVPSLILIAGVIALFNPTGVRNTAFIIIGISSLVYSLSELINWFKFARRRPKTPVTPHDEDIEDAKIIE